MCIESICLQMLLLINQVSLKFRDIWSRKIKAFIWQPLYYRTVKIFLIHQFYLNMRFNMAPLRTKTYANPAIVDHEYPSVHKHTYTQYW